MYLGLTRSRQWDDEEGGDGIAGLVSGVDCPRLGVVQPPFVLDQRQGGHKAGEG